MSAFVWFIPFVFAVIFFVLAVKAYFDQELKGVVDVVLCGVLLIVSGVTYLIETYINLGLAVLFLVVCVMLAGLHR